MNADLPELVTSFSKLSGVRLTASEATPQTAQRSASTRIIVLPNLRMNCGRRERVRRGALSRWSRSSSRNPAASGAHGALRCRLIERGGSLMGFGVRCVKLVRKAGAMRAQYSSARAAIAMPTNDGRPDRRGYFRKVEPSAVGRPNRDIDVKKAGPSSILAYQLVCLQIPFLCRYLFHTQGHPTADLGSHSHQSWAPLED